MLLNFPLIPLFLGIFANVSKESDFNPEYLFKVNEIMIEYHGMGKLFQTIELNTIITCYPFLMKSLQCDLHDVMTSEYSNLTRTVTKKKFEVEQSFKMEFNDCGLQSIFIKKRIHNNLIYDISHQFNLFFDIRNHAYSSFGGNEQTSSGYTCDISYDVDMTYMKKNAFKGTNSNFQIKLLTEDFSNQKGLRHIVNNNTNCMSLGYHDFLTESEVTNCMHTISVSNNKLKTFTRLDQKRHLETIIITAIHVDLIDIRARKTVSFNDISFNNWTLS